MQRRVGTESKVAWVRIRADLLWQAEWFGLGCTGPEIHSDSCRTAIFTIILSRTLLHYICFFFFLSMCLAHVCLEGPSYPMIQWMLIFTFSFWVRLVITFSCLQPSHCCFSAVRDSSFVLMSRIALWAVKCMLLSSPDRSLFIICLFALDLDGSITQLFSGEIYLSSHFT